MSDWNEGQYFTHGVTLRSELSASLREAVQESPRINPSAPIVVQPAPAVTRDELAAAVVDSLDGFQLRLGPNASEFLVSGQWQTLVLTGSEKRDIAAHVVDALIAAGHLRPTEGSDTDHA